MFSKSLMETNRFFSRVKQLYKCHFPVLTFINFKSIFSVHGAIGKFRNGQSIFVNFNILLTLRLCFELMELLCADIIAGLMSY